MVNSSDTDELAVRVGQQVEAHRLVQQLTVKELAERAGLSRTIVTKIERGEGNPSIGTLWKLSRALAVPLGTMLGEEPGPRMRLLRPGEGRARSTTRPGSSGRLLHADARERRTEVFELGLPPGARHESGGHLLGTEELVVVTAGTLEVGTAAPHGDARHRRRPLVRGGPAAPLREPGVGPLPAPRLDPLPRGVRGLAQPVLAGVVASFVGFASTFAVVLAGLRSVGATPEQAASGLLAICVLMGLTTIALSARARIPVLLAWSTPGAALLVGADVPDGGYPAAVGAFALCGALLALTGLWAGLGRLLARIPVPIASAMLAGVLLPLCLAPVRAAADIPVSVAPVVAAWALLGVVARRWAIPGALAVAVVVVLVSEPLRAGPTGLLPHLEAVTPSFGPAALLGLAVPLYVVTMASQNIPGVGVLAAHGFRAPLRPALLGTGGATVVGAAFGAFAINLAAITAALTAGPDAHPDPERRWLAAAAAGVSYLVLGLGAGLATALVASAPAGLIEAVAGLALLGALAGALTAALDAPEHREPALVTFVVAASGITSLGVSAAFWGLVAGLGLSGVQRLGSRAA